MPSLLLGEEAIPVCGKVRFGGLEGDESGEKDVGPSQSISSIANPSEAANASPLKTFSRGTHSDDAGFVKAEVDEWVGEEGKSLDVEP